MRLMSLNQITDISLVDISIITLYLVGIIWWGLRNAKNKSSTDYFLAGRNMGWAMVGLALFSASISTSTLIGHSGATYKYGLVIFNYNLISVLVMIFFAWIFLPSISNRAFIQCLNFLKEGLTQDQNSISHPYQ